jgi:hypothetical protein
MDKAALSALRALPTVQQTVVFGVVCATEAKVDCEHV